MWYTLVLRLPPFMFMVPAWLHEKANRAALLHTAASS